MIIKRRKPRMREMTENRSQRTENGPLWPIFVFLVYSFGVVFISGCAIYIGARGLRAVPVTPPKQALVRVTGSSIGISVGQNPATQSPEIILGYKRVTYDRIPTSAGTNVFIAPVDTGIQVSGGFDASISERLNTKP